MKERDIRNADVFNEYLKLVEADVKDFFDPRSFNLINCPACGAKDFIIEFEKLIFKYVSCKNCLTLFVNPRPGFDVLKRFYSNSASTSFWVNHFFKPVAESRREKIFKPRAQYLSEIIDKKRQMIIGDVGAGFGLFLDELRKLFPNNNYIAIEPSLEMAEICNRKGFKERCVCLEEIDEKEEEFDVLTAFELLEHLYDPVVFLKKAYSLLNQEGYLFMTTLNGRGFDILSLWEKSKAVMPPHHLNFFNPNSIKILFEKIGFKIMNISTPGKLDWDIVEGMIKNEGADLGKFWNLLAKEGTETSKEELQNWISRNNMSSHMWIVSRK